MNDREVISITKVYDSTDGECMWEVGKSCTKIKYHEPRGDGDAHYCDISLMDGKMIRVFRPDDIVFGEEQG